MKLLIGLLLVSSSSFAANVIDSCSGTVTYNSGAQGEMTVKESDFFISKEFPSGWVLYGNAEKGADMTILMIERSGEANYIRSTKVGNVTIASGKMKCVLVKK